MNTKIKFRLKTLAYQYPSDETIKAEPYVIVTMDEDVKRDPKQIFDTKIMARLGAIQNDAHVFELNGISDSIHASLHIYLYPPEKDTDNVPVYPRGAYAMVTHLSTLNEKILQSYGKPVIIETSLLNKLDQIVATYQFTFLESTFPEELKKQIDYGMDIPLTDWDKRLESFRKNSYRAQASYDKKMNEFIRIHFPYTFPGTKTMTLFNDFFGFEAKSLFYGFAYQRPQPTNAAFWQHLFQVVFQLFYGQECGRSLSPKETFRQLPKDQKLIILTDILTFVSATSSYLTDFARSIQNTITPQLGGKKSIKENIKYTEDFCPIHGGWSGDCVAGYEEIRLANGKLKRIEELQIGDEILSYDFEKKSSCKKKVTRLWCKGHLPLFHVDFKNGARIDVTWNHPMWVRNGSSYEKVLLSDIVYSNQYFDGKLKVPLINEKDELNETTIEEVTMDDTPVMMYDFEIDGSHSYVFNNGIIGHNCEDFSQFIMYMFNMFVNQCKDITKEEYPELYELQQLARHYSCFFALCGVERTSTESKKSKPSAHMAALLIKKNMLANSKVIFKHSVPKDDPKMTAKFENHFRVLFPGTLDSDDDLPNVLVCEGTGYLRSIVRDEPFEVIIKDSIDLPEYVKERVVMTRSQVPFYQQVFEILNNDMIDSGLNVQSFVFTYNEQQAMKINTKIDHGSFKNGQYQYGVRIQDILKNPADLVLVATPLIDEESIKNNKKLARKQLPYPPCHRDTVISEPKNWFAYSEVYPMVNPGEELAKLREKYASKLISELDGISSVSNQILALMKQEGKSNVPTLTYLLTRPRDLDVTIAILNKNLDMRRICAISLPRIFHDHCCAVVWISLIGTEKEKEK